MKNDPKKRVLSVLLSVMMVISLYSTFIFADDADAESGGSDSGYTLEQDGRGDGSSPSAVAGGDVVSSDALLSSKDGAANGDVSLAGLDGTEGDSEEITSGIFKFNKSTGTITGVTDTSVTDVEIPESISDIAVTAIGESAFEGCISLAAITIPDSVTTIGNRAFYNCKKLTASITIPDGVTEIGESAFEGCVRLTGITIPSSVTTIGNRAFYNCKKLATSITIPDGMTEIGESTFEGCLSLAAITISDSVTTIGNRAFFNCKSLVSIAMPDSMTEIGESTFRNCESLPGITIPSSVTKIGKSAFFSCKSLTGITIPNSVMEIGEYAFCNCKTLVSVAMPDSMTEIGKQAFNGCLSLAAITIPDGVTEINDYTFNMCKSLETVVIPDGVTRIGEFAFQQCRKLTNVIIPDSVTEIDTFAFHVCTKLEKITIPHSVENIGNSAFSVCDVLSDIYVWKQENSLDTSRWALDVKLTKTGITTEIHWLGGDIGCDYENGTLTDFRSDIGYIINGETVTPAPDGTLPIKKAWYGTDITIVKTYPGAENDKQILTIPGQPDKLGIDYVNGKITGFDPDKAYTISGEAVTIATDGSLVIDASWYGTELTITKKVTGSGTDVTETITIPGKPDAPEGVGHMDVSAEGASDGQITNVSDKMEYRLVSENDGAAITWKDCDGDTVTNLPAGMYEVRTKAVAGQLFPGESVKVEIGIAEPDALSVDYDKAQIAGFDPNSTYTIGGTTVTPSKDGTLDIDRSWYGTEITIEKTASGTGASITEKIAIPKKADMPTGIGVVNASGNDKNDGQITGVSDKMEYGLVPEDGTGITWKDCTGDTVTGLAPGKYDIRIKAINGETFASDPVEVTIGVTEPGKSDDSSKDSDRDDDSYSTGKDDKGNTGGGTTTTDPATPVNPTPTTPVTPDPTTPVTPDPVTPVTPDPVTPTTPDQSGTDQGGSTAGTTDQGNAGQSGSDSGNGSSSSGTSRSSDRDDDDRDSSGSTHRGNSNRGNSSSSHRGTSNRGSSSSNSSSSNAASGTSGSTDAATGNQDATGTTTDGKNGDSSAVSGITASIITDATSIAQTVKTKLDSALTSILKKDSKVQTGPYVKSDSDDIKVEIPTDLQKSGRTFYLMTATDDGDIVVLPNESTEDGMFEATGEADTDYQMIFEDGETPLAAMITNDGTLNVAEETNCYNHLIGLGLALIGLIAAALLARKGHKYFWIASAAGVVLALIATATGSCGLDWLFFAGEAIVTIAVTAALMRKKKDEQTDSAE